MQKTVSLLFLLLITIIRLPGQCLSGDSLVRMINNLTSSATHSKTEKIKALSRYEDGIAHCSYNHDSTHAFLLRQIGNIYSTEGDFLKAIEYYQKSVDLIVRNASKSSVNQKDLVISYYWLAAFNDSLHRINEEMKMFDSCYLIAIRLNTIDRHCLWALYSNARYSFTIGDYHRCIEYASLCETLAMDFQREVLRMISIGDCDMLTVVSFGMSIHY